MKSRLRFFLWCVLAAQIAACTSAPPAPAAPPPAPTPPPAAAEPSLAELDPATAAVLETILAGSHRSDAHRARDAWLHPRDTLLFFGVKPGTTVVEASPIANGWFTEVLAPLLAGARLYVAGMPADPANPYVTATRASFDARLAAHPEIYGNVTVTALGPGSADIAPPESCDLALAIGGLHGWMYLGFEREALAALHRALKPGGVLGVVDNRGPPGVTQDPRATNGYVGEDFAIALIESAGFELVARSEINANPNDTRDHEQGVWSLPPDYREGTRDRAKFEAIGESDRFTLKFRKR